MQVMNEGVHAEIVPNEPVFQDIKSAIAGLATISSLVIIKYKD